MSETRTAALAKWIFIRLPEEPETAAFKAEDGLSAVMHKLGSKSGHKLKGDFMDRTYLESLFDNVNGGDCVDSAAILEEITAELLAAAKKLIDDDFNDYKDNHGRLRRAVRKAEGRS